MINWCKCKETLFPDAIILNNPTGGYCFRGRSKLESNFHTMKGYQLKKDSKITSAMEDYLEMICRQAKKESFVRVNELAEQLNVRPSSASKMGYHLKALGLVEFEKYGAIRPTEHGKALGDYLLYRHEVLSQFFCLLNGTGSELDQVEQVEHFMNPDTVKNLEQLIVFLKASNWKQKKPSAV